MAEGICIDLAFEKMSLSEFFNEWKCDRDHARMAPDHFLTRSSAIQD